MTLDEIAYFDPRQDEPLGNVVITRVDDTLGFGPSILRGAYGGPQDTLSTASSIAVSTVSDIGE